MAKSKFQRSSKFEDTITLDQVDGDLAVVRNQRGYELQAAGKVVAERISNSALDILEEDDVELSDLSISMVTDMAGNQYSLLHKSGQQAGSVVLTIKRKDATPVTSKRRGS